MRCPASPRHALLAESLGKPSLWVIINAPWYQSLVAWPSAEMLAGDLRSSVRNVRRAIPLLAARRALFRHQSDPVRKDRAPPRLSFAVHQSIATLLVKILGQDAPSHAAIRADELLEAGDLMFVFWYAFCRLLDSCRFCGGGRVEWDILRKLECARSIHRIHRMTGRRLCLKLNEEESLWSSPLRSLKLMFQTIR